MSERYQPGLHPDADQLNAFVEHALPPHEREQTLAHLAGCAHCRSIVALSLPPVEDLQPQPAPPRRPWFLGWHLAWPVAAAFATLVPIMLYVHRSATSDSKLAQHPEIAAAHPPAPPLAPPAAAPPPAASAPAPRAAAAPSSAAAEKKSAGPPAAPKSALAGAPRPRTPGDSSNATPGGTMEDQLYSELPLSRNGSPRDAKAFQALTPGAQDKPANSSGQGANNGNSGIYGGTGRTNLNENYIEGMPAASAAAAPPPPAAADAGAAASSADQAVVVTGASARNGAGGAALGALALRTPAPPAPLPSGLPTLSTASNGRMVLALDTSNALFVSDDSGRRWRPVATQWKGRAVRVSLANAPAAQFHGGGLRGGAMAGMMATPAAEAAAPSSNFRGGIQGTVTDSTGAVVHDAEVIATDTDTGVQTRRRSNNDGVYSMLLQAGPYNVEVVAKGFQRLLQENVTVDNAAMLGLNLKLAVGSASETVTVTDAPPTLDTTDATLGGTIENELYSQLPLSMNGGPRDQAAKAKKAPPSVPAAPPAAQAVPPAAQAAPIPPAPLFEITTESNERWVSPDGQTWTRRP